MSISPVQITNREGKGQIVLLCEHASAFIPDEYDGLGLSEAARLSHAGWDPGALTMARRKSRILDAP